MSTFGGLIEEIPGISVDRFDDKNLQSNVYFLSHCHVDHMQGIYNSWERPKFITQLVEFNKFLYASHVSCGILRNLCPEFQEPDLSKHLLELDLCSTTIINIDQDRMVNCTLIPAGHCPGSVMFLFETRQHTILYTGDYRMKPNDILKYKALYDDLDQLKSIDKIYLDTTFFRKCYKTFPVRDDSVKEICNLIQDWIKKNDNNKINLDTSAKYGYENLFIDIYKTLNYPVHVNQENYNFYSRVPEMDKCVTIDADSTPIHSKCIGYKAICLNRDKYIRTIHISAWIWTNYSLNDNSIVESKETENLFNVCYSNHASYDEGVGLIKCLKPKAIEPNVISKNSKDEIYNNIEEILALIHNSDDSNTVIHKNTNCDSL